ncbi:MAG: carboxypeptidase-like regulatory domain-containing protein [Chitinophagales bacterium]|nr:carboxypeptidase-like regulatory domain-containing protein [Chitinophagales bacterium]MCZ2393375.1 carboxypeptidase-like regulatory domain-containing protein [Chitinophagales bacterium]
MIEAHIVNWKVIGGGTSEPLIGASIKNLKSNKGVITNELGSAILGLEKGEYQFEVSYLGYKTDTLYFTVQNDTLISCSLKEISNVLETIEVTASAQNKSNGVVGVSQETLEMLPTFFGERELVKAIQLLPGVQSGMEGSSAIFVRGGSSDQNLVALDGVPLFNLSHLFGIMSVFNSDVIGSADLYKNYLPSYMSNRLTSAISVTTKTPTLRDTHVGFQIGVLNSKIYLETPLKKNKVGLQVAMRGCHAGLFIKPISKSQYKMDNEEGFISYYFYDMNTNLNYKINSKNNIKLNVFFTDDRYVFQKNEDEIDFSEELDISYNKHKVVNNNFSWKNALTSISHQYFINGNLLFYHKVYNSYFVLRQDNKKKSTLYFPSSQPKLEDKINSIYASVNETGYFACLDLIKENHQFKAGTQVAFRRFLPNKTLNYQKLDNKVLVNKLTNNDVISTSESSLFIDYQFRNKIVDIFSGVRGNFYSTQGYRNWSILPRISMEFHLPYSITLQSASELTEQYLHMISGSIGSVMSDFWVPADSNVPRQLAYQNVLSVRQNIQGWNWSVDVFHRWSRNQIEAKDDDEFSENVAWYKNVIGKGKGRTYGIEFYVSKKIKFFTFTANYNLSKSERQFVLLNKGQWYPYTYDRRHDFSTLVNFVLNKNWDISATWVYGSGRPFTQPDLIYPSLGLVDYYDQLSQDSYFLNNSSQQIKLFEKRNNKQLIPYHHLDIGANYKWKKGKFNQSINMSIYNVYNRKNVFDIFEKQYGTGANIQNRYKSITLLPIMPSFSYALDF